jgi:integrase
MANRRLNDRVVRELPFVERGGKQASRLTFDSEVRGLAVRCTISAKAFVLVYRTAEGKQRQLTIGSFPDWSVSAAREEAARLKREIDTGNDPARKREEARLAPTMKDLARLYLIKHANLYKAAKSVYDDRLLIRRFIDPMLSLRGAVEDALEPYDPGNPGDAEIARVFGSTKVSAVGYRDIDTIHAKVTASGRRVTANRLCALLSKMFTFAERQGLRDRGTNNPCRGGPRNTEHKRKRVLNDRQLAALLDAIAEYPQRTAADAIMLAVLTGARQGELLQACWSDIDFERGIWRKPYDNTKEDEERFVPLAVPALRLLDDRRSEVDGPLGIPGPAPGSTADFGQNGVVQDLRQGRYSAWPRSGVCGS